MGNQVFRVENSPVILNEILLLLISKSFIASSDGKLSLSFKQFVNQDDFLENLDLSVNLDSNEIIDLAKVNQQIK